MGTMKSAGDESPSKNLQICNSCHRVSRGDGNWFPLENMDIPPSTKVAHGFCLNCCGRIYLSLPEIKLLLADKTQ